MTRSECSAVVLSIVRSARPWRVRPGVAPVGDAGHPTTSTQPLPGETSTRLAAFPYSPTELQRRPLCASFPFLLVPPVLAVMAKDDLCAITICGMRHRFAYASSHNARRRSSDVVAGLLRGLRCGGSRIGKSLGQRLRPALGGVPAFSFLADQSNSPSRDLFQLLAKPISRNDELRLHLFKCELQGVSIGRVMP